MLHHHHHHHHRHHHRHHHHHQHHHHHHHIHIHHHIHHHHHHPRRRRRRRRCPYQQSLLLLFIAIILLGSKVMPFLEFGRICAQTSCVWGFQTSPWSTGHPRLAGVGSKAGNLGATQKFARFAEALKAKQVLCSCAEDLWL